MAVTIETITKCAGFDYPQSWVHTVEMKLGYANHFPIGAIMKKSITIRRGQCPAQKYWKFCVEKLQSEKLYPTFIITDKGTLSDGPKFYQKMNNKEGGCIKVFMRSQFNVSENILQDFTRN